MNFRLGLALSVVAAAAIVVACSSSTDAGPGAVVPPAEAGVAETGTTDDADAALPPEAGPATCEGACKKTALVATFGALTRSLDRAQFGTQQGDAGAQLHTESHAGGAAECPSQSSPTPSYTLIVSSIPRGAAGGAASEKDGVTSAFFDFKGDLSLPPFTKAKSVKLSALVEDTATPPAWAAFDVTATFAEGSVTGHVYAEYCASLTE
jgi:hypothetical protein